MAIYNLAKEVVQAYARGQSGVGSTVTTTVTTDRPIVGGTLNIWMSGDFNDPSESLCVKINGTIINGGAELQTGYQDEPPTTDRLSSDAHAVLNPVSSNYNFDLPSSVIGTKSFTVTGITTGDVDNILAGWADQTTAGRAWFEFSLDTADAPSVPAFSSPTSGTTATLSAYRDYTFSWSASTDPNNYAIHYDFILSTAANGAGTSVVNYSGTTRTLDVTSSTLMPYKGTTLYAVVRAVNSSGLYSAWDTITCTVSEDVNAPTLTVSPTSQPWTANAINISVSALDNETGINFLKYAFNHSATPPLTSDTPSWTAITVSSGTKTSVDTSVAVPSEGDWWLHIYTGDVHGNNRTASYGSFQLDTTLPSIAVTGVPVSWVNAANLVATATDPIGPIWRMRINKDTTGAWVNNSTLNYTATENGTYTIDAMDAAGNMTTVTRTISYVDTTGPDVSFSPDSATVTTWQNSALNVTVTMADSQSGLGSFSYYYDKLENNASIANIPFGSVTWTDQAASSSKTFALNSTGQWYIYIKAVDAVGNITYVKQGPYKVDVSAPAITNFSPASATWTTNTTSWLNTGDGKVTVTISDTGSGIATTEWGTSTSSGIEPTVWNTFTGNTVTIPASPAGNYYLHVRATDNVGRVYEAHSGMYSVILDSQPPVVTATTTAPAGYTIGSPTKSSVTVSLSSTDASNTGTLYYQWATSTTQPGSWTAYTVPVQQASQGSWYLHVKAVDTYNNTGYSYTGPYVIQKSAPPAPVITLSNTSWTNQNVTVTLATGGSTGGGTQTFEWQLNGTTGTWTAYTGVFSVTTEGTTVVYARATDQAGNTSSTSSATAYIDKAVPTGSISGNPTNKWQYSAVPLTCTASDALSGMKRIKKPDGNYTNGSTATYNAPSNGTYTFTMEDNAGNTKDVSCTVSYIDTDLPTATITAGPDGAAYNYNTMGNIPISMAGTAGASGIAYYNLYIYDVNISTTVSIWSTNIFVRDATTSYNIPKSILYKDASFRYRVSVTNNAGRTSAYAEKAFTTSGRVQIGTLQVATQADEAFTYVENTAVAFRGGSLNGVVGQSTNTLELYNCNSTGFVIYPNPKVIGWNTHNGDPAGNKLNDRIDYVKIQNSSTAGKIDITVAITPIDTGINTKTYGLAVKLLYHRESLDDWATITSWSLTPGTDFTCGTQKILTYTWTVPGGYTGDAYIRACLKDKSSSSDSITGNYADGTNNCDYNNVDVPFAVGNLAYLTTGYRVSPPISLRKAGVAASATIDCTYTAPAGTGVKLYTSLDRFTWSDPITSFPAAISGIPAGKDVSNVVLYVKEELTSTGAATPSISSVTVTVPSAGASISRLPVYDVSDTTIPPQYQWFTCPAASPNTTAEMDSYFSTDTPGVTFNGSGNHVVDPRGFCYYNSADSSYPLPNYLSITTPFAWSIEGFIYIPTDGTYTFGIDGDDAIDFFIDNLIWIGWYGGHGLVGNTTTHTCVLYLTQGYHQFKVRIQGNASGPDGLMVQWKKPGDAAMSYIPAEYVIGEVRDSALRINTSSGVGYLDLVEVADPTASPIRVQRASEDLTGKSLLIRETLTTQDSAVTPAISSLTVSATDINGNAQQYIEATEADFTAGTLNGTIAAPNGTLQLGTIPGSAVFGRNSAALGDDGSIIAINTPRYKKLGKTYLEDNLADFSTGTLTNLLAKPASLVLTKSGVTDFSRVVDTQADFQSGTLTNVAATADGYLVLNSNPAGMLKSKFGTTGFTNNYTVTKDMTSGYAMVTTNGWVALANSYYWVDGGGDTFDNWGFFEISTPNSSVRTAIPFTNINTANGAIYTETFSHNNATWQVKYGWTVAGIFVIEVSQQTGSPQQFVIHFGGNVGSDSSTQRGDRINTVTINGHSYTLFTHWNNDAAMDSTLNLTPSFPNYDPQITFTVVPFDAGLSKTGSAIQTYSMDFGSDNEHVYTNAFTNGATLYIQWGKQTVANVVSFITADLQESPAYYSSGNRVGSVQDISSTAGVEDTTISWVSTEPAGTSVAVETRVSFDSGNTWGGWNAVTNSSPIPGLDPGTSLANARLQTRVTLNSNLTATPQLDSITATVSKASYSTSGTRVSPPIVIGAPGQAAYSNIDWVRDVPPTTNVGIDVSWDGGATWTNCSKGGPLPGIDGKNLLTASFQLRERLTTTDVSKTPSLNRVLISIESNYGEGIWVEETTTNILTNASFDVYNGSNGAADGWNINPCTGSVSSQSLTVDSSVYRTASSTKSQKVVATVTNPSGAAYGIYQTQSATTGTTYTASVYCRGLVTGTGRVRISIEFKNSSSQIIQTTSTTFYPNSGVWGRYKVTATAPANTVYATVTLYFGGNTVGDSCIIWFDDVQLEPKSYMTSAHRIADTSSQAMRLSESAYYSLSPNTLPTRWAGYLWWRPDLSSSEMSSFRNFHLLPAFTESGTPTQRFSLQYNDATNNRYGMFQFGKNDGTSWYLLNTSAVTFNAGDNIFLAWLDDPIGNKMYLWYGINGGALVQTSISNNKSITDAARVYIGCTNSTGRECNGVIGDVQLLDVDGLIIDGVTVDQAYMNNIYTLTAPDPLHYRTFARMFPGTEVLTVDGASKTQYVSSGRRVAPPIDMTPWGQIGGSTVTWTESKPSGVLFNEIFTSFSTNWQATASTAGGLAPTIVTDASATGGKALQLANGQAWYAYNILIPFDPTQLYILSAKLKQASWGTDATKCHWYIGVEGVAEDRVTKLNIYGENSYGSQHYFATSYGIAAALGTWYSYTGYIKGYGVGGTSSTGSDCGGQHQAIATPGKMFPGVKYLRPLFITNYSGGNGTALIDYIKLEVQSTVSVDASIDGGTTWLPVTNGGPIPGLNAQIKSIAQV